MLTILVVSALAVLVTLIGLRWGLQKWIDSAYEK